MANLKKQQEEVIASIDTAKAIVDKIVSIMEITLVNPSLAMTFAGNPIGFLLQLLKELGITYEDIRLFLTNFLVCIAQLTLEYQKNIDINIEIQVTLMTRKDMV